MDAYRFDALSRVLGHATSRRAIPPLLGGLLALLPPGNEPTYAKKKKKKKATLCLDGQTIQASKKKKKKLLKSGATPGACPAPPPPVCTPNCPGTACGGADGCGGTCTCGADAICHDGVCRGCTVTCNGDGVACGNALETALVSGTVYACPGRYFVNLQVAANVTLVGAGDGDDPTKDTILDANGNDRAMLVLQNASAALHGLRITGGNVTNSNGGGIYTLGSLALTGCTVHKNKAKHLGGGIFQDFVATGPVTLNDCMVTENSSEDEGGGLCQFSPNHAVTLANSTVSGNTAADGGGIFNEGGTVTLNSSTVSGNNPNNCAGSAVAGCSG